MLSVQWIDLYYRAEAKENAKPLIELFIKDLKDCLRFYNLPNNDFALLYANEKKSAEELVKRMEMIAVNNKDEAFMKQLNVAFPTIVQSASIQPNATAPQQIFR